MAGICGVVDVVAAAAGLGWAVGEVLMVPVGEVLLVRACPGRCETFGVQERVSQRHCARVSVVW
jgi:hypothetical protein